MLTPSELRSGLAQRILADVPGITESVAVQGITAEPNTLAERAFAIVWRETDALGERVRRDSVIQLVQRFDVVLVHRLADDTVWASALDDAQAIRRALLRARGDGIVEVEGSIRYLGSDAPITIAGGAYLLQRLRWSALYTEDLS